MATVPEKQVFVTAGEDTFVNVWQLGFSKDGSISKVDLIRHNRLGDHQPTGVVFST